MRRELLALATVLLIAMLGWFGYGYLFGTAAGAHVYLSAASGEVTVVGPGGSRAAIVGEPLIARDRVATGPDGKTVLSFGPETRVTLGPSGSLKVVSMSPEGLRLELEGGRVQATIRPGSGTLGIDADGRKVTAEDADFSVVLSPAGGLGVETSRGDVGFVEGAEARTVGAGDRLLVAPGEPPLSMRVSEELLLQVRLPETAVAAAEIEVSGTTEPRSAVRVGEPGSWQTTRADDKGRFSLRVPLPKDGANALSIEAVSVFGGTAVVSGVVRRDLTPPPVTVDLH